MTKRSLGRVVGAVLVFVLMILTGTAAQAAHKPFGSWLVLQGNNDGDPANPGHGYVSIPHDPELNPTGGITIEMWVKINTPVDCRSLFGKAYTEAYWIGICGDTLRAYLRGGASPSHDGGTIPDNQWTHIAVTSDGVTQRHFINGNEVDSFPAGGNPTTSSSEVRIGSDSDYPYSPPGAIDEVRLWSIARTEAQLQSTLFAPIVAPQPGLVAVWPLNGNGNSPFSPHDGTLVGNTAFASTPAPPAGDWISVPSLPGYRVKVRITPPGDDPFIAGEVVDCVPETICIAGALETRSELFIRVIGPRPNGYMHAQVIKFTPSRAEVWIEQTDTEVVNYYDLEQVPSDSEELPGFVDRTAFLPE